MKNIIRKLDIKFSQILTVLIYIVIFYSFGISKARAATGFEKFDINLNWLLTGDKTNKAPENMANAELGKILNIIARVTSFAVDIAGVIALIMILYSAFMYATSFGEESKAEAAKKALTWSIVGIVVIIFFRVIIGIVNTSLQ